jgi:sn-glycerol 3-phosphate transport system permease protein
MEHRVVFAGRLFPALLLMPQLAVTIVFFFWPAAQALVQSVLRQDAFGLSTRFVGWENFTGIFADPSYLASVELSCAFSFAVAVLALTPGLLFAVMADRVVRGATFYKTVLMLPYAIAPAIAGVLWLFLFNPSFGVVGSALRHVGIDWNFLLNGRQALLLVILAAAWKQIGYNSCSFSLGCRQSRNP